MALTLSDIKVYKAANNSDTTANGGLITNNEIVDVVGALFPNVDNAERLSGSTKWRKAFFKIISNNNTKLLASRLYQDADTDGDDIILFTPGDSSDTQGNISSTANLYAAASLKNSVSAGVSVVEVVLPTYMSNWFITGQQIRITDIPPTGGAGNEEFLTISGVSVSGNTVTLTLSDILIHGYSATSTRVMNVYNVGDIGAYISNVNVNSSLGLFDQTKITCTNIATVDATWNITFTSSTVFTVTNSLLSTPVTGNTASTVAINNPIVSLPYFSLDPTAFSGTFSSGDTIAFKTNQATTAIWLKRIIPAGASPVAVNKAYFVLDGGSV